jgi:outer membrane immunogenic protein
MKKLFLASVMVTATMMTQAGAADMAVKAPRAAPIQYSDWSGFYVGIEGGYGWGRNRYDDGIAGLGSAFQGSDVARLLGTGTGVITSAFTGPSISTANNNGFLAGGFFGAQKQYGSWVFGIEGDIDAANLKASTASSSTSKETVVRGTFENPTVTLTGQESTYSSPTA